MDEEKVISTGEQQSGEEHRSSEHHHHHSSEHRHHSSRHRRHSRGENLEGKRESWREPRKRKILLRRLGSAAFAILSVVAVLLMLYVAYIYLN